MRFKVGIIGTGLALVGIIATVQAQEFRVQVSPASIPGIEHQHTHNVTAGTLKRGDTEFHLGGAAPDVHIIKLSQEQVKNLLNGTTVIVDTEQDIADGLPSHVHRLTITKISASPQAQESSGW